MSLYTASGLMVVGLALLAVGGELLVRSASTLAAAARISPLVIGLTIVAFGTSAPELAVTLQSSLAGETEVAIGNVVGSNILNVLFILGLSAIIAPLVVSSQLIRLDVPLMVFCSLLLLGLARDQSIGRLDGALLFGLLLVYIVWSIRQSRREHQSVQQEYAQEYGRIPKGGPKILLQVILMVAGLICLTLGARLLVSGAVAIAQWAGMSELLIGLTIVAVGTSLPEVAASIVATVRGERDIAVGNVVGSNIFNILCVLGLSALVAPSSISVPAAALRVDIPIMIAVAVACLPIFFTGRRIDRWEGVVFFLYYLAYIAFLVLSVMQTPAIRAYATAMLLFVLPLTAITLIVGCWRTLHADRRARWPSESD